MLVVSVCPVDLPRHLQPVWRPWPPRRTRGGGTTGAHKGGASHCSTSPCLVGVSRSVSQLVIRVSHVGQGQPHTQTRSSSFRNLPPCFL